jgi:hypothetical protein
MKQRPKKPAVPGTLSRYWPCGHNLARRATTGAITDIVPEALVGPGGEATVTDGTATGIATARSNRSGPAGGH